MFGRRREMEAEIKNLTARVNKIENCITIQFIPEGQAFSRNVPINDIVYAILEKLNFKINKIYGTNDRIVVSERKE